MSSTNTEEPLHEVILKVMYLENPEKAAEMKASDILWKIDNPEISERHINEALEWMVHKKMVTRYIGKYSIDRIEFLRLKELYSSTPSSQKDRAKKTKTKAVPTPAPHTFYVTPPSATKKSTPVFITVIFIIAIGALSYLSYTLINFQFKADTVNYDNLETTTYKVENPRKLYISTSKRYNDSAKNAISNSFYRQNAINSQNIEEFNYLHKKIDSLQMAQLETASHIQKTFSEANNKYNALINKILWCNALIVLLIIYVYFSRYN